jgi:phage-related minor tail protein
LAKWQNDESNKPTRKAPKSEEVKAAEKTEDVYKRLIKQQQEQIALGSQNTELAKIKYQVTQGELASLEQAKKETLLHNAALIDQKNIAEQLKTFREGLADSNAAARDRGNIDFLGAGMGDKARDRMKEMADIRTDFLKQQRDLQRDFSKGRFLKTCTNSKRKRYRRRLLNGSRFRRTTTKKPMNSSQTGGRGSAIP